MPNLHERPVARRRRRYTEELGQGFIEYAVSLNLSDTLVNVKRRRGNQPSVEARRRYAVRFVEKAGKHGASYFCRFSKNPMVKLASQSKTNCLQSVASATAL